MSLGRLLPVYLVVFVGFVGYSTMITVFTPMFLRGHGRLIPPDTATGEKTILLGLVLCMYPLAMYLVDEFHLDVSKVSEFIAWVSVPTIIGSLWLAGVIMAKFPVATVAVWSGVLTALAMILIVIPSSPAALWITLFLTGLPLSVCMAACATLLSNSVSSEEQGSALGNNQALQVFAESASGLVGGVIAALLVKGSLLAMAAFVLAGSTVLLFGLKPRSDRVAAKSRT